MTREVTPSELTLSPFITGTAIDSRTFFLSEHVSFNVDFDNLIRVRVSNNNPHI